jgi:glycosyltransferase involved in cell wall biosynthesis
MISALVPVNDVTNAQEMTDNLTIAIPVRNEERNLAICLEAIGKDLTKNVIVIDSGSTDATVAVAHRYGAKVIQFNWNGRFPKKRNWYLENHNPGTEWILFLDADEIISHEAKTEIKKSIENTSHQGFQLSYTNYFLGRRLKGGYPLRKVALFRANEVRYELIDEDNWSKCDMEVHEHPEIRGSIGLIRSRIDHRDLRGLDSYMEKHNQYAAWEAKRLLSILSNPRMKQNWKLRQHLKYKLIRSPWGALAFFLGSFLLMGGWKDGSIGFSFSLLKAAYFVQIACRLKELETA